MTSTSLTPAQRKFMQRDAHDGLWTSCAGTGRLLIARNLQAKGLGKIKGIGVYARFHFSELGQEVRGRLLGLTADRLAGVQ